MGSTATLIIAMVTLGITVYCQGPAPRSMASFIAAVEQVEGRSPELRGAALLRSLRGWAGLDGPLVRYFLGPPAVDPPPPALPPAAAGFLRSAIAHRVTAGNEEEGVVLTEDGTTVALEPLLLGLEAGLVAKEAEPAQSGVYALALAHALALSFLRSPPLLGPDGCWDSVTSPRAFSLSGPPSLATDALLNGGMDGVILGAELSGHAPAAERQTLALSGLLRRYYQRDAGQGSAPRLLAGIGPAPRLLAAPLRRQIFRELISPAQLGGRVREALELHRRLTGEPRPPGGAESESAAIDAGVELFVRRYTECPAIIPRCLWGARPYRGTPTLLALPLPFLYVHHTEVPGQPCLSFPRCAADMRAMQRFHQDERGWDDIGYSFVVGGDGYVYEGRGWSWQGAHTKGHNAVGYGVAFIGNYNSSLPPPPSLELLRDRLTACAVGRARLTADYVVHAHRQLVDTTCPGDALYSSIQGWPHFREVQSCPLKTSDVKTPELEIKLL